MSAEPNGVRVTRRIAASPERAFAAWIDPDQLARWGVTRAAVDARVGGRFRFETESGDGAGNVHVVSGEYRELVPGRRVVKTWIYEGPAAPGRIESLVTADFREAGPGAVEVTVSEEGPSLAGEVEREQGREAWIAALDTLAALMTNPSTERPGR